MKILEGISDRSDEVEDRTGNLEHNVAKNFPNLEKEIDIQVQEVQRVPHNNPKWPVPRHIIIKMSKVKDKERLLKAAREKQLVMYKGAPIRLSADFSEELCRPEGIGTK